MKNYLNFILSQFKWFRKNKGGKWYHILDEDTGGGTHGPVKYWTQMVRDEFYILEIEEW